MKTSWALRIFILIVVLAVKDSIQISLEEELTLTYDQKVKLDKFKALVESRLPHDHMKEDIFLVRWLRVNDFNIPAAEKMIMENVKWREENNIDNILEEDWSDFDKDYRISVEGCDKSSRPVISTNVGDWDMRKAAVTGQSQRMMRYTDKLLEEGYVLARHLLKEGHNVTQVTQIFDMTNFNLMVHGCPQCLAIYAYNFQSYEKHYPLSNHKTILVNTPAYFHSVFQILKPLLSKHTRDIIRIYGRDKKQWQSAILEEISPDNLSKAYGGRKSEAWDVDDLRHHPEFYECKNDNNKNGKETAT